MSQSPIVPAAMAVVTETAALAVGFGIVNNAQAGLGIALGVGLVNLGALIYAALHKHTQAVVAAAQPPAS